MNYSINYYSLNVNNKRSWDASLEDDGDDLEDPPRQENPPREEDLSSTRRARGRRRTAASQPTDDDDLLYLPGEPPSSSSSSSSSSWSSASSPSSPSTLDQPPPVQVGRAEAAGERIRSSNWTREEDVLLLSATLLRGGRQHQNFDHIVLTIVIRLFDHVM